MASKALHGMHSGAYPPLPTLLQRHWPRCSWAHQRTPASGRVLVTLLLFFQMPVWPPLPSFKYSVRSSLATLSCPEATHTGHLLSPLELEVESLQHTLAN